METQEKQLELHNSIRDYLAKRNRLLPDVAAAQEAVINASYQDGVLSSKVKRLIALGVALSTGCVPCIIGQTRRAVEAGATKEEVLEAASVLLAIHGTSGYSETWRVVKILEEMDLL